MRWLILVWVGWALIPSIARPADTSKLRFTDATRQSGVRFKMTSGGTPSREILEVNGGGVALFDYDNDGDLDLFLANGATLDDTEHGPGSRLYANDGSATFEDVTSRVGIDLQRWAMGVAVGDYDGDGDDDLYVTCFGSNVLLRNDGGTGTRRFVDVTAEAGVGDSRWSSSAAFADFDGDGDLDLYVANYLVLDVDNPPERKMFKGAPVFGGPIGLPAAADVLYENLGDGKFQDATRERGAVPAAPGYGLGVVILDLDRDGKPDIFVGNDSSANFLFRNLGQGRFEEIGASAGVAANYDGRHQATMGIAISDLDGNGYPDIFTTNFSSDINTLHLNLGRSQFDDRTSQFGLAVVSRPFLSWGTGFYDFDSDGDEDLFIASGHIYPEAKTYEIDSEYEQPVLLFERSGKRFARYVGAGEVFDRPYGGRSAAFGDLDGDGDVDIVMTVLNGQVRVFRNESPPDDVLVVGLRGRGGNLRGLGSVVQLVAGDAVQRRWIHGGSYQSVDAPLAYFGLGGTHDLDKLLLRVAWANGATVEYGAVPVNRRVTVTEGDPAIHTTSLAGRER